MSLIDYGAVLIKNGKVINENQFFMDMEKSVGCKIDKVDGQYMIYAGDPDFVVATYKTILTVAVNKEIGPMYFGLGLGKEPYESYRNKKVRHCYCSNGVHLTIKKIWYGVYHAKFTYKGDFYSIIYGHGIDPDFKLWDQIKVRYLGKKGARKVDNLYKRLINRRMHIRIIAGKLRAMIDEIERESSLLSNLETIRRANYTPYIDSTLKRQELINRKFEIENEQKDVILSNLAILQLNSAKHMLDCVDSDLEESLKEENNYV